MLHNLFGVWIDKWQSSAADINSLILPHLFRDFSMGVFSMIMIYLFWTFFAGTINTARDGTFLVESGTPTGSLLEWWLEQCFLYRLPLALILFNLLSLK